MVALIRKGDISESDHDRVTDLVVDCELNLGVTLSVVPLEYDNYIQWRRILPYYMNIDKEGIILWKAA